MHFMYLMAVGLLCQQMQNLQYIDTPIYYRFIETCRLLSEIKVFEFAQPLIKSYLNLADGYMNAPYRTAWADLFNTKLDNIMKSVSQPIFNLKKNIEKVCKNIITYKLDRMSIEERRLTQICNNALDGSPNNARLHIHDVRNIAIFVRFLEELKQLFYYLNRNERSCYIVGIVNVHLVSLKNIMNLLDSKLGNGENGDVFEFEP
eukprot:NODE_851_length_3543_cov_0.476771.p2 type:complete len:204 gc:universal NODE_851_length_3543_cov_0.476771:2678-2067(-)